MWAWQVGLQWPEEALRQRATEVEVGGALHGTISNLIPIGSTMATALPQSWAVTHASLPDSVERDSGLVDTFSPGQEVQTPRGVGESSPGHLGPNLWTHSLSLWPVLQWSSSVLIGEWEAYRFSHGNRAGGRGGDYLVNSNGISHTLFPSEEKIEEPQNE